MFVHYFSCLRTLYRTMFSRSFVLFLSLFQLALYTVRSCVAGAMLNDAFNGKVNDDENSVTFWLTLSTIINSMIGAAAAVAGVLHYLEWNAASRFGTVVGTAVAMTIDYLIFGFALKQWEVGDEALPGDLGGRAQFLGAAAVISFATQTTLFAAVTLTKPSSNSSGGSVETHGTTEVAAKQQPVVHEPDKSTPTEA